MDGQHLHGQLEVVQRKGLACMTYPYASWNLYADKETDAVVVCFARGQESPRKVSYARWDFIEVVSRLRESRLAALFLEQAFGEEANLHEVETIRGMIRIKDFERLCQ